MEGFKHILVPTDFGESADCALERALEIARKFESKITVVHAAWLPPTYYLAFAEGLAWPTHELQGAAKAELDAVVAKAGERYPYVEGVLEVGEPWRRILEATKEHGADLVVMGTHGRRGLTRVLLGSVAEKIVRLSPVPVMTVCSDAERKDKARALELGAGVR